MEGLNILYEILKSNIFRCIKILIVLKE